VRRLAAFLVLASLCPHRLPAIPQGEDPALLEAEALLEKKSYKKAEEALRAIVAAAPYVLDTRHCVTGHNVEYL